MGPRVKVLVTWECSPIYTNLFLSLIFCQLMLYSCGSPILICIFYTFWGFSVHGKGWFHFKVRNGIHALNLNPRHLAISEVFPKGKIHFGLAEQEGPIYTMIPKTVLLELILHMGRIGKNDLLLP